MTVKELIDLLSTQPADYEVAVRTIDDNISEIRDDSITELAEVETPDDDMPGYVILNYENNVIPELEDDELEDYTEDEYDEPEDDEGSTFTGPDGHEWTWEQWQTWIISLSVRNELEMFHGGGAMDPENPKPEDESEGFITDRQMKAMNIVIRHKVYELFNAMANPDVVLDEKLGVTNGGMLNFTLNYINEYMEPPGSPELEEAYRRIKNGQFDPPGFVPDCTRSEPPDDWTPKGDESNNPKAPESP